VRQRQPFHLFPKRQFRNTPVINRQTSTARQSQYTSESPTSSREDTHITPTQRPNNKNRSQNPRPSLVLRPNHPRRIHRRRARPGTRRRVTLARASGRVTNRPGDLLDQIALDDFQCAHLLPDTRDAIVGSGRPLRAADDGGAVTSRAGLGCCLSGGGEEGQDLVSCPRGYFGGGGHPAGEVGFEGELVDVAVVTGFAGDLVHDCSV
jgi:hypothetical protein